MWLLRQNKAYSVCFALHVHAYLNASSVTNISHPGPLRASNNNETDYTKNVEFSTHFTIAESESHKNFTDIC